MHRWPSAHESSDARIAAERRDRLQSRGVQMTAGAALARMTGRACLRLRGGTVRGDEIRRGMRRRFRQRGDRAVTERRRADDWDVARRARRA